MPAAWLQRQWFQRRRPVPALWFLLPLNGLFVALSGLKRALTSAERLPVPVVVVGNLTVGGAGKTPVTLALVQALRDQGWRPGVVSRGYRRQGDGVVAVLPTADAGAVGDEPLLLARRSGVPVWVGSDRVAAGRALLAAHPEVDVILCDDGLQHHRLARDVEIAVFDGRGAGNGWRLPLGPLREPLARLSAIDAVVCNGARDERVVAATPKSRLFDTVLRPGNFYRLNDPARACRAADLAGRPLHAVAGIGDPERFFRTLEALGLAIVRHPFPDHHAFSAADLAFGADAVLLMTEKDAVKCAPLATGEAWVLPVSAELPPALIDTILEKIRGRQTS